MPAPLEFWFDFASTYSYVAALRIEALCAASGVPLQWKAFLLGPVFARQGWDDSPFNLNPLRGAYMWRDMERLTEKFGLGWRKPSRFPRASTRAARIAAAYATEPWCGEFIRHVFEANFARDQDIAEPGVLAGALREAGQSESLIARSEDAEHRGALRANTEAAIARNIFGAPNCLVRGELFWGEESLDDAIAWARG